jgi:outer membrane protein assembly factor BamB
VLAFLRRPRVLIAGGVIAVLLAGGAVAAYLIKTHRPGNVSNPEVPFEAPTATATTPVTPPKKKAAPQTVNWPRYGYTVAHTRSFQPEHPLNGPWKKDWTHQVGALTEFPPVIWDGRIFQLIDDGELVSLNAKNGKTRWTRSVGRLAASAPAVDATRVFVTVLQGPTGAGRAMALRQKGGGVIWSKSLPSRTESSPLLIDDRLYFGSENGTLYCLDADTGRELWTYHANGAIKGSPSYADGKLYFGNYGGDVQAVRASDGKLLWRNGAGTANFYATAAVAFGRVYIGNTDGREYSFAASDGRLAWAHQTGGYVYSSAAVDTVPGVGPTVFVGSYDGTFYALDARSGAVRWRHESGGKLSGSPTVIGNTVYFANYSKRSTTGLSTRTGRVVFRMTRGSFDPVITDGVKLYVTGGSSLTALSQPSRRSSR